jgi:hypothetical protein
MEGWQALDRFQQALSLEILEGAIVGRTVPWRDTISPKRHPDTPFLWPGIKPGFNPIKAVEI